MSKRDEQIARMKGLMTYGISNTTKKTPVTESIEGPDGKIYAIIREGSKFYIKSANKGSELVTESFNYIGGYMNKKNNEYSSYNQASKNLELKVRSLNESYGINKPVELLNPDKKETLMVEMTDTMKASIARYREIMNNTAGIMKESNAISMNNTGNPEAPKTSAFSAKLGAPFNNSATAKLDKDLKQTASDPEKQGDPFSDNITKAEEYKDAQYVPKGSVANQKPSGGKVVRVNENSEFEETIEECDEWGSCGLPSKEGVGEVGDDDPFTVTLDEDAESFVGFADEDDEMDESEESEDLDLDDIDLDLEDETESDEDEEIDDIDSDELLDDEDELDSDDEIEYEIESDDEDEIESLRNEVEELRNLINDYIGDDMDDSDDDIENEYDLDIDTDSDEDEFDDEDDSDEDYEDYEDEDEYISDSIRPRRINEESIPFKGNLPGSIELHSRDMNRKETYYGAIIHFLKEKQAQSGDSNDEKFINAIINKLKTIFECEKEIKYYKSNKHINLQDWKVVLDTMLNSMYYINNVYQNISFLTDDDTAEEFADLLGSIEYKVDVVDGIYQKIKGRERDMRYSKKVSDIDDDFLDFRPSYNVIPSLDDDIQKEYEDENKKISNIKDSINPRRINESNRLNDFGKHPGYRKKVMSLPKTGSDNENGYYDWNDDSVYSEEPFGTKIGKSSPFDNVVEKGITSVLENLKKKI